MVTEASWAVCTVVPKMGTVPVLSTTIAPSEPLVLLVNTRWYGVSGDAVVDDRCLRPRAGSVDCVSETRQRVVRVIDGDHRGGPMSLFEC